MVIVLLFLNTEKNMTKTNNNSAEIIRYPAVAGQFYPAQKSEIAEQLQADLQSTKDIQFDYKPRILLVPHAGYIYSGQVMAAGFKTIESIDYHRVIILGVSHNYSFDGIAASSADIWQTPLGAISVDQSFIDELINQNEEVFKNDEYHRPEHSLEVEIPWLQSLIKNNFKVVPLLLGNDEQAVLANLAKTLSDLWDDDTLLVISSDLSHYPPYKIAREVDNKILDAIVSGKVDNFYDTYAWLEENFSNTADTFACGHAAIAVGMMLAEDKSFFGKLLAYANSGDVSFGDKDRVVGYGAVVFGNGNQIFTADNLDRDLTGTEQNLALKFSRAVLENYYFSKDNLLDLSAYPVFQTERGVFVTLRDKRSHGLRGCIGNIIPTSILADNIKEMSIAAATNDPRFQSVTADELDQISIEVSVLSPMRLIQTPDEIELGKHGVLIKQGFRTGVFLPQVATETGWDLEIFMSKLCTDKAGIEATAWQTGQAEIYVFTAQVFGE